jgi:hypothetical protein
MMNRMMRKSDSVKSDDAYEVDERENLTMSKRLMRGNQTMNKKVMSERDSDDGREGE